MRERKSLIQCGYIFILGVQNFAEKQNLEILEVKDQNSIFNDMSDIVIPLPDIEIQKNM